MVLCNTYMVEGTVSDSCAMPDSGVSFLRIVTKTRAGDDVICPTCLPDGLDYADYIHVDYALIDVSDAVYLMHNWETSPGAVAEKEYAELTGKRVLYGRHTKPHVVKKQLFRGCSRYKHEPYRAFQ